MEHLAFCVGFSYVFSILSKNHDNAVDSNESTLMGKGPFVHNALPFCPLSLEYKSFWSSFDKKRIKMVATVVFQQNVK